MNKKLNYPRAMAKFRAYHTGDGRLVIEQILNYTGKPTGEIEKDIMWELFHTRSYKKLTKEQFRILGVAYHLCFDAEWKGIEHTLNYLNVKGKSESNT